MPRLNKVPRVPRGGSEEVRKRSCALEAGAEPTGGPQRGGSAKGTERAWSRGTRPPALHHPLTHTHVLLFS